MIRNSVGVAVVLFVVGVAHAAEPVLPPGDPLPVLRLETGGPRSSVSGLAFSADSRRLYAGGWDKAVQVWDRAADGRFQYSSQATLRVPAGGGLYGGLNALALSDDGQWLATAGEGYVRDLSGERNSGWVVPAGFMSREAELDEGLIYVFNTATRQVLLLRGHRGPVQSLTFVHSSQPQTPELVSFAEERGGSGLQRRLRYWDVKQAREIAGLDRVPDKNEQWAPLPDISGWRPGLVAWSTGQAGRAHVAMSLGDDEFRIWDTQTRQVAHARTNPNNILALALVDRALNPQFERVLTAAHGQIGAWALGRPQANLGRLTTQQFQPAQIPTVNNQQFNLPRAAVVIPGSRGRSAYLACVVSHEPPNVPARYRLVLATLNAPITTVKEVDLWQGELRQPALAASPDGQILAIAGNDRNDIRLFSVEHLLNANPQPFQTLQSIGEVFSTVALVRSGERWGIRLTRKANQESLVYDFDQHRVEAHKAGDWKTFETSRNGWKLRTDEPGSATLQRAGQPDLKLQLSPDYVATNAAVCPKSNACTAPLVAVASDLRGQPLLEIFCSDTGEMLRRCTAHTQRIRDLSFSADGRMLVSSSDDRTVAVWTLTDLDPRTIGKRGRMPGVVVRNEDGGAVVGEAAGASPLRAGDVVVSCVDYDKLVPIKTAADFYQHVLNTEPKETLTLEVRRDGKPLRLECPIGQAADETKPLFSLFVTAGLDGQPWSWIGWHPLGNFDTSDDKIERRLGWHFNTGDPAQPAKFAAIGEYRKDFFTPRLLENLLRDQELKLRDVDEKPQVSLWLRYRDGRPVFQDFDNIFQMRSADAELVAEVTGVAERRIHKLTAAMGDEPLGTLEPNIAGEWTISLAEVPWQRGRKRLSVLLETAAGSATESLLVQFHQPRAQIEWKAAPPQETRETELAIAATVTPGGEPVHVELSHYTPGQKEPQVLKRWDTKEALNISETVALQTGTNRIELVAWNADAPVIARQEESARKFAVVYRTQPMAPRVTLGEIQALPEQGQPVSLEAADHVWRSTSPRVRVRGRISAEIPIETAVVSIDGKERELKGFAPKAKKEFDFSEDLALAPGKQTIFVNASAAGQKFELPVDLEYAPPLPKLTSLTWKSKAIKLLPADAKTDEHTLYAGYHEPQITLSAELQISAELTGQNGAEYQAEVLLNDEPLPADAVHINRQAAHAVLTTPVALAPGRNRIAVRITNAWNREPSRLDAEVEFRRPPTVLEVTGPEKVEGQEVALTARFSSPLPLELAWIAADDDSPRREFPVKAAENARDEWELHASIGLATGDHQLRIGARNSDGTTIEPAVYRVTVAKPADKPPVLQLLSPQGQDVSRTEAELKLEMSLASATAATIEIRNLTTGDVIRIDQPEERAQASVPLVSGSNQLELVARNSGGSSEVLRLQASRVDAPGDVDILSVGSLLKATGFRGRLASARARVTGKVKLPVPRTSRQAEARVWVNDFMQPTVPVREDGSFQADIVLNKPAGNLIKVEVFTVNGQVAIGADSSKVLRVDCEKPERRQELFLLLLGAPDDFDMEQWAQKALGARRIDQGREQNGEETLTSPTFVRIRVRRGKPRATVLQSLLADINHHTQDQARGQSIVMLYYQGQIRVTEDDFTLVTAETERFRTQAITGRLLEKHLSRSYGAHLVALDLQQANLESTEIWPKAPHLGVVATNWKGGGPEPARVRLISTLEKCLPDARVVRDLARKIDQNYVAQRREFPDQIETVDQLKNLYDLDLGATP